LPAPDESQAVGAMLGMHWRCGGCGSLCFCPSGQVGAEFLASNYPGPKVVYLPAPTWANHHKIFPNAGIEARTYRYYLPSTRGLDFAVSRPTTRTHFPLKPKP
jgi:aspartate/tyrosine/aromatic aminotransferase